MNNDDKNMPSLKTQKSDIAAFLARAGLGAVPVAGSLLAEIAGTIIPNQRAERVVKFAEKLEIRLSQVEESFIQTQLANEEFIGVIEEAMIQASKSTSDERITYIASIVMNGMAAKEVAYNETKRMLTILGELSDAEIILLRFYLVPTIGGDEEFREKHKEIVMNRHVVIGSPQSEKDKESLRLNYKEHLISLGLLDKNYETNHETGLLEIDNFSKAPKIRNHSLNSMGNLFLRYIGLAEPK